LKTSPAVLRLFGLILAAFLVVVAALPFAPAVATEHRAVVWTAAALIALLAALAPRALAPVYALWTRLGGILGWINTRVLLGAVFFAIVLPLGLLRRSRGRQLLPISGDPLASSYRIARAPDTDPARFERPY